MGLSTAQLPFLILRTFEAIIYVFLLSLVLRRRIAQTTLYLAVLAYIGLALLLQLTRTGVEFGWLAGFDAARYSNLAQGSSLVLAFLLYFTMRVFLRAPRQRLWFWGGVIVVALVLAFQNILLTFLGWAVFSGLSVWLLLSSLARTRQPLQRNRLAFWAPALLLVIANDLAVFYQPDAQEGFLRLGGAILVAYVVWRHHIPDVRDVTRQFLIYILTALAAMFLYIAGFLAADSMLRLTPGYNPLFVGTALAVVISLIFTPLSGLVRGLVNRVYKLESYDPAETLREYSVSISNILDLEKLATVSIDLILEAMDVRSGFIFLVDPEIGDDNKNVYRLTAIRGGGNTPSLSNVLAENSSIARFLREEHKPLLQYDVDFAPEFLDAPLQERRWLGELELDVYVPIHSKGEWIGLLALGPKSTGRYTEDDLKLLMTLASQTGVALENARLVENLKRLNVQVREAYAYLDRANHDLAKLEMTKSNFISIASHELRTPLTVVRGYTEMLLEDPAVPEDIRTLIGSIHKSTLRLHEIMDSMFDIAQMDSRTLELHRQDVFPTELVGAVANDVSKAVSEREQELDIDLPQLPSIKADPNALKKLFFHLMMNAIKFTPNGGKITVTGHQVPANNRDLPEGGVEIVVSDTGVGVDKGYQEIIFTKFYQPGELLNRHSTGKTKFKGSGVGLGLALSRGIVEAHGGRIWVESEGYDEENCPGSEFHVILPLRSQGESKTVRMGSAVKLKI